MSYEGAMLEKFGMPAKVEVEKALLKTLFKYNGTIKEFASGEDIVDEIANSFSLNIKQRNAVLERIYKKENRIVKTPLWHRLLYRSADSLAKTKYISRPKDTFKLTNKKEWMLTENGYERALELLDIPSLQKEKLIIKSFEVQKLVNEIKNLKYPKIYNPFTNKKERGKVIKQRNIRSRAFRQSIIELYNFKCSICGLKICSPDKLNWEVEAAHIVPHSINGKDDIWNGIALCRFHHWAFDVGWFSFTDKFKIIVSSKYNNLTEDLGNFYDKEIFKGISNTDYSLNLPENKSLFPHKNSIKWHRENILIN